MDATAGHRLTLDPMGKYSNAFYSETTNNLGLIKFIVSEKMLLFDFPIGCSMYVKAMPCCEDHL
jgi:hypothetical protein